MARRFHWPIGIILLLAQSTIAAEAPRGSPTPEAQACFANWDQGKLLFGESHYVAAADEFLAAHECFKQLKPADEHVALRYRRWATAALSNAGTCASMSRDYDQAIRIFDAVRTDVDGADTGRDREEIEQALTKLRAEMGVLLLRGLPRGASVKIDGRTRVVDADGSVLVGPGSHQLDIGGGEFLERQLSVRVREGDRTAVDAVVERRPVATRGLVAQASAGSSPRSRPGDHAIVIGADHYQHWPTLTNAIRDARRVEAELRERYHFETRLLEDPPLANVRQAIEEFGSCRDRSAPARCADGDQLLVFVAGHGAFDGVQGALIFADSDSGEDGANQLSHEKLKRMLDCTRCRHVLLVLDTCYAGTIDERIAMADRRYRGAPLAAIDEQLKYRSRRYFASVGNQPASDDSPFARGLLDVLRSQHAGGVLTLSELVGAMDRVTPRPVYAGFGDDEPQGGFVLRTAAEASK